MANQNWWEAMANPQQAPQSEVPSWYATADANDQNMYNQMAKQQAVGGYAPLSQQLSPPQQVGNPNYVNPDGQGGWKPEDNAAATPYLNNIVEKQGGNPWIAQQDIDPDNQLAFKDFARTYGMNLTGKELGYNPNSKAPTWDVSSQAGWDRLDAAAKAADYGKVTKGISALNPGWIPGQQSMAQYKSMGDALGFDSSKYNLTSLEGQKQYQQALDDYGNQFVSLKALTGGWGGTGDAREAATTLYRNDNGTLRAVNDPQITRAAEKGSWLAEHGAARVGILGALMVATAGAAGVGAGAAGAAGEAGAAGGAGAAGSAGAGAAANTGIAGSLADAVGMGSQWAALSPVQQAMVTSAVTNAASTGVQGGSLGDVFKSAVIGAATGGAGAYAGSAINGALGSQMPAWAAKAGTSAALGGGMAALQGKNAAGGALMGGLGSLVSSGVGGATGSNTLGQLASQGVKYGAGQYVQDSIKGDVTQQRQQLVQDIYQQAAQRGISSEALNRFLQTPQGRAAMQAEFGKLGSSGTLQSLFA